ncbi:EamA family transporter [Candidatus Nitrosocosmicus arcticus]|uniref:Permease of the drug/metabolite transporter (DMT) superfamily n=1 Tax=Candidatus Nitrosocosmicus arcticus TaxID=2035267 RepID=A0A557SWX1_9ARCH|nr:EamA family transporter [Candidatus Nitrosocosmicus arcticus]TVP41107.1 Permease of the drug/metabolite transporter (DMT) superfamily [Candidatus Nitrosocosmicus arcticus]
MTLNHQTKIWLILISLWVINGSSFLAIKVAIDTIPPLLSAGLRFSIAGAILFTVYFLQVNQNRFGKHLGSEHSQKMLEAGPQVQFPVKVSRERITLHQWKDSLILGVTLFLGGQGLLTWGAQYLSSGMTGLLNSTIPLWVAIIGYLIYRWLKKGAPGKKMSKVTILGLVTGFSGLMLLIGPSVGSGDLDPIGTIALIISSVFWAIGSIYSTRAQLPVSILASSGMIMITGGLMLTGVSFMFGEYKNLDLMQVSIQSIIAQIYLIGIITVVGFTDFYWLLRVTSASLANTFAYVSPVIAVLLGWAILHENLTLITVIAMAIILAGVALMVTKKRAPSKSKQI